MKIFAVLALLVIFGLAGIMSYSTAPSSTAIADSKTYAQEDCAEGETWNEATGKCDKS